MSHTYSLTGIINGKHIKFNKRFNSREDAINYMLKYFEKEFIFNTQVEDEVYKEKHDVEYVISFNTRFEVARVS